MWELNKFCCCFTIKSGVMMTGIWTLINLFFALIGFDLIKVALLAFTGGWFIALVLQDTKWRRFGFLASYVTQVFLVAAL